MKELRVHAFDSLQKIMVGSGLDNVLQKAKEFRKGSMLKNEIYSFVLALEQGDAHLQKGVYEVEIISPIKDCVTLMMVGSVPVNFTTYSASDDDYIQKTPGLFPDVLTKIEDSFYLMPFGTYSIQVLIEPEGKVEAGEYPVTIVFRDTEFDTYKEITVHIEVMDANLPPQELIYTCWFHSDCVAQTHKTEVFSQKHWDILKKYIKMSAKYGSNMILTPVFTPPLDTKEGGDRLCVQLVDVEKKGDAYRFGFEKLEKWITMCKECGMEYFEVSHLFTQWGAKHAPKIMATENGEYKKIFGWETDAASREYKNFMKQFLKALDEFFVSGGHRDKVYFHISDEPHLEHLEFYRAASEIIGECISGYPIMDALSDVEFYKSGLVKQPIPSTNSVMKFIENGFENRWTYYCCGGFNKVSNRFMAMPSARCRIFGIQLYYYDIKGFLHWGFNFYNARYSLYPIDPYKHPDSDSGFPAGDAFMVYPAENGCKESLRLITFHEALQDLRALKLLENCYGKEFVMDFINKSWDKTITFEEYPRSSEYIMSFRERINALIKEKIQ